MNHALAAAALVAVGTLQMAGDLAGAPAVKAIGAITHASPAPKVFTSLNGLETFSARFFIDWIDLDGEWHVAELTPQVYGRIRGPYNRRNPYGATIAYAPQLAADQRLSAVLAQVTDFGFCGRAPLLKELNIPRERVAGLNIRLAPRADQPGIEKWQTSFPIDCEENRS